MKNEDLKNALEDKIIEGEEVSSSELNRLTFKQLQNLTAVCFGGVLRGKSKGELIARIKNKILEQ